MSSDSFFVVNEELLTLVMRAAVRERRVYGLDEVKSEWRLTRRTARSPLNPLSALNVRVAGARRALPTSPAYRRLSAGAFAVRGHPRRSVAVAASGALRLMKPRTFSIAA